MLFHPILPTRAIALSALGEDSGEKHKQTLQYEYLNTPAAAESEIPAKPPAGQQSTARPQSHSAHRQINNLVETTSASSSRGIVVYTQLLSSQRVAASFIPHARFVQIIASYQYRRGNTEGSALFIIEKVEFRNG